MNVHDHIVTCRACTIDDCRFCEAVPEAWARQYRERAESDPAGHRAYADRVIQDRIKRGGGCSTLCHPSEPCTITADGKCDAAKVQILADA